ncbi:DUF6934 family protein [Dyadobacter sp. CY326]|uniref:DUF6934 family protein n=1 Tax=Dyadobacter sp. CY326 TaxID=2907300 RepID=UPI001F46CDE5|nr:hypothetical protein [Dyadobacter sp. CY326]MCE7065468.1 hypothetical protein [Dyadobacter sp. CY326]
MNEPFYDFTVLDEAHRFDFLSIGRTAIHKAIFYFKTEIPDFYNLVLAETDPDGELNIYSVSNNGDMKFILSTVYKTMMRFLDLHPNAVICFSGSTLARTRLYRTAISLNLKDLQENFDIYGVLQEEKYPEVFCKNKNYKGFFICRKNLKFTWH